MTLSQQIREALDEIRNDGAFTELYNPSTFRVDRALYRYSEKDDAHCAVHELDKVAEVLNLIPQLLTEHEALQRKADAGADIVASMENAKPWCDEVTAEYITRNLAEYREATKPSDV